jgi:DNA-binding MarR family transcriptional regulator
MVNKTTHQHSWRLVTRCLFLKLKPSEKVVLQALAYHYPKPYPSIARIAELAGVSKATAKRALRVLVHKGLIFKHWRDKRTTVYELKVDRILMQADKREKKLAQNERVAQFDPDQNDPLTETVISTGRDNKSTDHASNELDPTDYENEPQELNAGMEIESDDYPDLASSSDLTEDAQSALGPNCTSSDPEDGEDKDHSAKADLQKPPNDIAPCQLVFCNI